MHRLGGQSGGRLLFAVLPELDRVLADSVCVLLREMGHQVVVVLPFILIASSLLSSGGRRTGSCWAFCTPLAGHELGAFAFLPPILIQWALVEAGDWRVHTAIVVCLTGRRGGGSFWGYDRLCSRLFHYLYEGIFSTSPCQSGAYCSLRHSLCFRQSVAEWGRGRGRNYPSCSFDCCPPVAAVCGDVSHLLAGLLSDWLGVRSSLSLCHFLLS